MGYLISAIERTAFEIAILFGGVFALATALWVASQQLRGDGYGRFGNFYLYFVAPGVACHETGHALGCILTGTRIVEFVPFRPVGKELGHVTHEGRATFLGQMVEFVIGTGPVWFGCLMIFLISRLLGGRDLLDEILYFAPTPGESIAGYFVCVFKGALAMLWIIISPERWGSILFPVCFYLIFCIASEITLSPSDLRETWHGFVSLVVFLLLLNLIPGISNLVCLSVDAMRPFLFGIHVLLLFVLLFDLLLLLVANLCHHFFSSRNRRWR